MSAVTRAGGLRDRHRYRGNPTASAGRQLVSHVGRLAALRMGLRARDLREAYDLQVVLAFFGVLRGPNFHIEF